MKTKLIILSILCLAALRSWSLCPVPPSNCNFRIIEEQVEEAQSENVWEKIGWGSTTKEQCKGSLSQLKQNTPDRMRMAILNGPLTKGFVTEEHLKCLNGKTYSEETKNEILGRYAYLQSRLAENAESLMNYLAYADAFISGSKKSLDANTCKSLAQNLPNAGEKCSELVADCDRNKPTAEEQNQYFENMANGYINSDCKKTNLKQDEKEKCQSSFPWAYGAEFNRVLGRGEKLAQAIQRQIQLNASLMKERLQKVMQLASCTNTGKSGGKACEIDDVDELIDALPIPSDDKVPVELFKNEKNEERRQNLRMNIANRDYNNCLGERGKDRKKSTHDWNLAVFSMATAPINGVSVLAVRGATALAQSARLMNSVRAIRVTNMARRIPIGTVADDALLFKEAHKTCTRDEGETMIKPQSQDSAEKTDAKRGSCQLRKIAQTYGGSDYQSHGGVTTECLGDFIAATVVGGTYSAKPVMGAVRKILGKPEASQAIAKGPGLISRTVGAVAAPVASIGKAVAKGAVKVTTPVITAVTKSEMVVQLKSSPLFQKTASFLKDKAEKVKLRVENFKSNEVARKNFDAYGDAENTDAALKALKVLKSKEKKDLAESVVDARELIAKINDSKDSGLITKTLAEKILEKPLKPETMEWIIQQRKAGQLGSQIPAELQGVEIDYLRMLGLLP